MKVVFHLSFVLLLVLGMTVSCGTNRTASGAGSENLVINQGYSNQRYVDKITAIDQQVMKDEDVSLTMAGLFSRTPGISVFGSGRNLRVMVRGRNSINSSSDPLFVVDGQIMGQGFSSVDFLDPLMVGKVSVLKDGASASAYGVRGANGVILIDLKKN